MDKKIILSVMLVCLISINSYAQYVPKRDIIRKNFDIYEKAFDNISKRNTEAFTVVNSIILNIYDKISDAASQNLSEAAMNHVYIEGYECTYEIENYIVGEDYTSALPIARRAYPKIISRINEIVTKDKSGDYYKKNALIGGVKLGEPFAYVEKVLDLRYGEPNFIDNKNGTIEYGYKGLNYKDCIWDNINFSFAANKKLGLITLARDFYTREAALFQYKELKNKLNNEFTLEEIEGDDVSNGEMSLLAMSCYINETNNIFVNFIITEIMDGNTVQYNLLLIYNEYKIMKIFQ